MLLTNKYFLLFISLFCLFTVNQSKAQYKYEREFRVTSEEVPKVVSVYIHSMFEPDKIKWYREENLDSIHFEAKTKYKGDKYSIEFNEKGKLIDIERKTKFAQLPLSIQTAVDKRFDQDFIRWKIQQIQFQYVGKPDDLKTMIVTKQINPNFIQTNYEIEVIDQELKILFEYLFDSKGNLLEKSQMVLKNLDNLVY